MMKSLTLVCAFLVLAVFCHAQNFSWVKTMPGTGNKGGRALVVDALGNIYTTGWFMGTADFDPGPGVFDLTAAGNFDIYISKFDASGNFAWAKAIGGTGKDEGLSIAVDAGGNVYTAGYFNGTVDFDPGPSITSVTSAGQADIFVLKLNTSGDLTWVKTMGGASGERCYSIAVDLSGNVYSTGTFEDITDLDPSAASFNLTSAGQADIYVSKLDASGSFYGLIEWAAAAPMLQAQ